MAELWPFCSALGLGDPQMNGNRVRGKGRLCPPSDQSKMPPSRDLEEALGTQILKALLTKAQGTNGSLFARYCIRRATRSQRIIHN